MLARVRVKTRKIPLEHKPSMSAQNQCCRLETFLSSLASSLALNARLGGAIALEASSPASNHLGLTKRLMAQRRNGGTNRMIFWLFA
jgi:hypothetical protein